ncbi:murein peptide amidase A [Fibrobacter sp. UWB1]|uniref:murein tripeptide amidase MpaA n=1 Tax=Fibrobacter sp. UWB1 TaxID=1964355 RepID=UPI000B52719C|nr:murein tripeptide amidase MpaA [Fibrobacter sp. UWB1]OWV25993.1 murein peptide amidase A [Fibrobacter sp. UWB1]
MRSILALPFATYGRSALGASLRYIPCSGKCRLLVVAGIHGEEPETTFLLSRVLRAFEKPFESVAFVLCANPDGMAFGTRGNANGVDLNRNFPTSNWSKDPVGTRSILEAPRDTFLSTGIAPGSEPETVALVTLIQKLSPEAILSMHAPMACVEAPVCTPMVESLCEAFGVPWHADIGYPTPGSLGTWCKQQKSPECITLELPRMSLEALFDRYALSFALWLESV